MDIVHVIIRRGALGSPFPVSRDRETSVAEEAEATFVKRIIL